MKTISDLDGFVDICNETELYATEAGCSNRHPDRPGIGPIGPIGPVGSGKGESPRNTCVPID